ncbi:MAG TPA: type III-A CRISPR-associated RAMP protein Csm3 [Bacteroidales bacterium]|nr:type III-A CRISPR-associated RAMP protein Csm3 [Bacteroidales bacterium]
MKLEEKIVVSGTLELLTGMHIGDSKENVEIGGIDSPVVRRKDNNQPYIPGSSLKGKIRSLLEISEGANPESKFRRKDYPQDSLIPELFGASGDDGLPSRLIVRDSYLTSEWAEKLSQSNFTDMPFTEIKFENVINRLKGTAEHPRQIERVPAGAVFEVEFVINIFSNNDGDNIESKRKKYLQLLKKGIKLLEDDYLGGSGSRGYGQVKLTTNIDNPVIKKVEEY